MPMLNANYISHKGHQILFGKGGEGLYLNEHDLRNFNWNVQTRGNRIISVNRRGVQEHTLPAIIVAQTEEKAKKLADKLYDYCEEDLLANQKGTIVVNGYNLRCFVRGQDYSDWSDTSRSLKISLKVIRDSIWYKTLEPMTFGNGDIPIQITTIAQAQDNGASPAGGSAVESWTGGEKGYFHGYPYDYPSTLDEYVFENNTGGPLSWQAIIFGPASVITFDIGNHTYAVPDVTLADGERLEITAKEALDEKTVIKIAADGTRTNCFANRSSTSYLFEPIPTDSQVIRSAYDLTWRLTPIIERSTPSWL